MSEHTPEPWTDDIIDTEHWPTRIITSEDWNRAKACVNACAGIPTEALEGASVRALVDVVKEAHAYLAPHPANYIGNGSILHQKFCDALAPFLKGDNHES